MPHRRPRRSPAPAALLLVAACGAAPPDPGVAAATPLVALTFGVHRIAVEPPFSARRVEPAGILVRGTFEAPCAPYGAAAALSLAADTVVLRIVGQPTGACRAAVQSVAYDARIDAPIATARTVVRVVHEGAAGRPGRETVFVAPL
jgi:hypothetical protein